MWGSSFADLAKKAAEQASTLSAGDLFNLDSMQGGKAPAPPSHVDTTATTEAKAPSFMLPSIVETSTRTPPSPPKEKPQAPKGKLVMPSKKSPKNSPNVSPKKLSMPSKAAVRNGSSPKAEKSVVLVPHAEDASLIANSPMVENNVPAEKVDGVDKSSSKDAISSPDSDEPVEDFVVVVPDAADEKQRKTEQLTKEASEPSPQVQVTLHVPEEKLEGSAEEKTEENLQDPREPKQRTNDPGDSNNKTTTPSLAAKEIQMDAPQAKHDADQETGIGSAQETKNVITDSKSQIASVISPKGESMPSASKASPAETILPDPQASGNMSEPVPEHVMQQFTAQLQRLQESFELERQEMQQRSRLDMAEALASRDNQITQVQELLKEKDKKVRELLRIKEGNELRMDSLKREVVGIKALLEEKNVEGEKLSDSKKQKEKEVEKKLSAMDVDHTKTKLELKKVQDELVKTQAQLRTTNEEYSALKSRVKTVAGELKERRSECRDLAAKIEELQQANDKWEEHISALDSQLSDRDRCGTEKDEEVGQLRSTIEDLAKQLKQSEKKLKAQETSFENDLATYKRKAQNSLSVANARAAAAIQAREEADLEANAARSTSATMMDRARVAEANGEKAMVEAKKYYEEMEKAKEKAVAELEVATNELETVRTSLADSLENLNRITAEKAGLAEECSRRSRDLETERSKLSALQLEIAETKVRARDLQNDATELRGQLQKARAADDAKSTSMSDEAPSPTSVHAPVEDTNSRATLMMLQKQLAEANAQIDELKELMHNALTTEKPDGVGSMQQSPGHENGSKGNGGAPLFYAIEKQAELNTARNEINRLASLYSNLQSEKFEAQEALETALRELGEERAKLGRYEKLNQGVASSSPGSPAESDSNAGRTNIEYLKNIIMRYFGAKTLAEKKALIPVIGAVLCLTPDEQAKAVQNLDSSVGVEGFGMALFESFGSRVGR